MSSCEEKLQQWVYAAAASMGDLRCGDLVEVEWESDWYPGVVSDIPKRQELAVNYVNGDFEESVPASAGRLRSFPLRKRPGDDVRKGSRDRKAVAAAKLRLGGNRGDIGIVMEALAEGAVFSHQRAPDHSANPSALYI